MAMKKIFENEEMNTLVRCHTVKFRLGLEQNLPVHEVLLRPGAPLLANTEDANALLHSWHGTRLFLVLHNIYSKHVLHSRIIHNSL